MTATGTDPIATDQSVTGLGESRRHVLAVLQDAGEAMAVADVAARVQLHANTVRFHLDGLIDAGLVQRSIEERDRPGRPRTLYAALPDALRAGQRSYQLLAQILTSYVEAKTPDAQAAALESGEAWGRYVARRPPPFQKLDAAAASSQLSETLDDIGFAPEEVVVGNKRRINLHQCPFREIAVEHRDVVCSVHLGLMRGVLEEIGAPIDADRLEPFVEPDLCVTHLASRGRKAIASRGASTPAKAKKSR